MKKPLVKQNQKSCKHGWHDVTMLKASSDFSSFPKCQR